MPILIKSPDPSTGIPEWIIVELQGDLETRSGISVDNQFIGDLMYNKYGQPILIIGHHILHGKEQKIDKPFGILERVRRQFRPPPTDVTEDASTLNLSQESVDSMQNSTILDNTVTIENKTKVKTELFVRALVRKKLIFKARPKPIIANVAKKV